MTRGVLVSFEGSEGCGKSTQIRRLARRLENEDRTVVVTREPGGTPIGEEIRHLLQFSKAGHAMTPEAELLLFTASRAQLTREVIEPALDRGAVVLADRFLDSTTVYQGVARRLEPGAVALINRFAVGNCLPDLTFIFDLDPAEGRRRLAARNEEAVGPDRMEQQPQQFYLDVRAGYLELARTDPSRFHVLNAAGTQEEVGAAIDAILNQHGFFKRPGA